MKILDLYLYMIPKSGPILFHSEEKKGSQSQRQGLL